MPLKKTASFLQGPCLTDLSHNGTIYILESKPFNDSLLYVQYILIFLGGLLHAEPVVWSVWGFWNSFSFPFINIYTQNLKPPIFTFYMLPMAKPTFSNHTW